jgi:putative SOS response-associated peptidase YedK
VVILLRNWVVILNWNQVLILNWNWVVNITGICNHTTQTKFALEVETRFKAVIDDPLQFTPQKNINGFDYPKTPVIIDKKPNIITHYNWGLIPAWAKDEEIKKHTLNAKIETVNEKPFFKNSVDNRCLIIANGYYEWQWLDPKGKEKQKHELRLPNEELFAFAGFIFPLGG